MTSRAPVFEEGQALGGAEQPPGLVFGDFHVAQEQARGCIEDGIGPDAGGAGITHLDNEQASIFVKGFHQEAFRWGAYRTS